VNIVVLTHCFPPGVNAPASRTHEHCREWLKAGHDVTVVTCAPNHPIGVVYTRDYRNKLRHEEWRDGIRVIRLWTFLAANQGFARRAAAHAEETYDRRVLATRFERIMASLLPDVRASERCTFA
jgi:hypothetical protein